MNTFSIRWRRMPDTPVVFSNALRGLGNSAEEVAQALRNLGIRGVRNAVRGLNPIVKFLATHDLRPVTDPDLTAGVSLQFYSTRTGKTRQLTLPTPVFEFLEAFNRGAYPDIELPPDGSD